MRQLLKLSNVMAEKPRTNKTREKTERKTSWQRPYCYPTKPTGWCRVSLVRTSTLGASDNKNVSSRFREGWEPVLASEHPEMHVMPGVGGKFEGNVESQDCYLQNTQPKTSRSTKRLYERPKCKSYGRVDNYMRESNPAYAFASTGKINAHYLEQALGP